MFIREIVKKSKNSRKKYIQHRLIESVRTIAGPRHKIVLHLGTLKLPKENWKDLANTIESIVNSQKIMFPVSKKIEKLARHYASLIIRNKLNQQEEDDSYLNLNSDNPLQQPTPSTVELSNQSKITEKSNLAPDYEFIDIHSITNSDARTIGAEHVAVSQMKEYKFFDLLKQLDFTRQQIINSAILIAGRLVHPGSELETARWARTISGIGEFFGVDLSNRKLSDQALHRSGDMLYKNRDTIEQYLSERAHEVFSLDNAILLFDLTNTYFEGSKKNSHIARFGNSKEKRSDCPLVTLGLVVDAKGFPKYSRFFQGNVSEAATLEQVLEELSRCGGGCGGKLFVKTVVIDAGIATEENLKLLKEKHYAYIAVSRKQSYKESFWENMEWEEIPLKDPKEKLLIKADRIDDEVYLLCHSSRKEYTESSILKSRTSRYEKAIAELNGRLKRKRTQKKYEKIVEQIGRLKEKYGVGKYYEVEISQEKGKVLEVSLRKRDALAMKKEKLGNYVLRTNRQDLSNEEISKIHRTLTMIEHSFKEMKTDLGMRPVHHQVDRRIESHLFITVLGYHMVAAILHRVQKSPDIPHSWRSIKNILSTHQRVTTTCISQDGRRLDIRNSTIPTQKQMEIYKALGITAYPLKSRYFKIKKKNMDKDVVPMNL